MTLMICSDSRDVVKGENRMRYEEPIMDIRIFQNNDVVTLSGFTSGSSGSGDFEDIFNGNGNGNF